MRKLTLRVVCLVLALCMLLSGCTQPDLPDHSEPTETKEKQPVVEEPKDLPLIENGKGNFRIVYTGTRQVTEMKAAIMLMRELKTLGVEVEVVQDFMPQSNLPYEIVVGQTARESADTYQADRELVGESGYLAEMVGNKLFLCGGNSDSTYVAVEWFIENVIKPAAADGKLTNFSLKENYLHREIEPRKLPAKIAGEDLNGYVIACQDLSKPGVSEAVEYLSNQFVKLCGVRLPSVSAADAKEKPKLLLEERACDGVEIKPEGKDYVLSYNTRAGAYRAVSDFWNYFSETKGEMSKNGVSYNYSNAIYYEDYGVKGDGKTDDSAAIKAAHDAANAAGKPVMASAGATYYFGGQSKTVTVQTDTDWRGASFIVDDTNAANPQSYIFDIRSKTSNYRLEGLANLKAGADNLGVTFDTKSLVRLVNSKVIQYIRKGPNVNNGSSQSEVILVHPDGTIDQSTPLLWDYETVTSAYVYPVDKETLTVRGGTFTTIANQEGTNHSYYLRSIQIYRSNTVVKELTHYVTGEGEMGAPYYGFVDVRYCDDVLVEDCVFSGHKTYKKIGNAGTLVEMGTYDITAMYATNVTFKGCTQANSYLDRTYWGIMGSNYCKSLSYVDCVLSRFDAHSGVANASVIDSTLGWFGLSIIGFGTLLIENTTTYGNNLINFRSDYGSSWDGDVIIRNVVFIPKAGAGVDGVALFTGANDGTHNFGYTCYLPKNIMIDGLTIMDSAVFGSDKLAVFDTFDSEYDPENPGQYPLVLTEKVEVKEFQSTTGTPLVISRNKTMFGGIEMNVQP